MSEAHRENHLYTIFEALYESYGPQGWWPADTPFEVMVGAILTQNTAWSNVEKAIANLRANDHLSAQRIAAVARQQLALWLRPSGYFNIKAQRLQNYCRWYLSQGGWQGLARRPTGQLRQSLLSVNGIGPETADDILLYAFGRPVFVIDAYTRRLFRRVGTAPATDEYEQWQEHLENQLKGHHDTVQLFNEYHALIVRHGKLHCRPQPRCETCKLKQLCSHYQRPPE